MGVKLLDNIVKPKKQREDKKGAITVALAWSGFDESSAAFAKQKSKQIDLDLYIALLSNNVLEDNLDFCSPDVMRHSSGAVLFKKDSQYTNSRVMTDYAWLELGRLPEKYDRVVFIADVYLSNNRGHRLTDVGKAKIIYGKDTHYMPKPPKSTSIWIAGELTKSDGLWSKYTELNKFYKGEYPDKALKSFLKGDMGIC